MTNDSMRKMDNTGKPLAQMLTIFWSKVRYGINSAVIAAFEKGHER
jgi:hypothetical protein